MKSGTKIKKAPWFPCGDIQEVDKMMETLRNLGVEFVGAGYIERTSVGNTKCSFSFCFLLSVVLVSVR
jgi:hypothetical protein